MGLLVHWSHNVDSMMACQTDSDNEDEIGPEISDVPEGNLIDFCEHPKSEET